MGICTDRQTGVDICTDRQGVYVNQMVFTTWFLRLHHVGHRPRDVSPVYPELVSLPWL